MYKARKMGNNENKQKIRNTYPPLKKKAPAAANIAVSGAFLWYKLQFSLHNTSLRHLPYLLPSAAIGLHPIKRVRTIP